MVGLRKADALLMPMIFLGRHPRPVAAIAEKAADMVAEDRRAAAAVRPRRARRCHAGPGRRVAPALAPLGVRRAVVSSDGAAIGLETDGARAVPASDAAGDFGGASSATRCSGGREVGAAADAGGLDRDRLSGGGGGGRLHGGGKPFDGPRGSENGDVFDARRDVAVVIDIEIGAGVESTARRLLVTLEGNGGAPPTLRDAEPPRRPGDHGGTAGSAWASGTRVARTTSRPSHRSLRSAPSPRAVPYWPSEVAPRGDGRRMRRFLCASLPAGASRRRPRGTAGIAHEEGWRSGLSAPTRHAHRIVALSTPSGSGLAAPGSQALSRAAPRCHMGKHGR